MENPPVFCSFEAITFDAQYVREEIIGSFTACFIDKTWTSVARLANSEPIRTRLADETSICGLRV